MPKFQTPGSSSSQGSAPSIRVSAPPAPHRVADSVRTLKRGSSCRDDSSAQRRRILDDKFCPEGIQYLYDVLGLDLWDESVSLETLRNIADGRMTDPLELVVRPVCWDRDRHDTVVMPPVKVVCSVVIRLPYDPRTFRPVPPSASHRVYLATYPCRPYLVRRKPTEDMRPVVRAPHNEPPVDFSSAEKTALEGLGIRSERLYPGSFGSFPYDARVAIGSGEFFEMSGVMRVDDPFGVRQRISVAGRARLVTGEDGSVSSEFEPHYPVRREPGEVVDIVGAACLDRLQLDLFRRDADGREVTDAFGNPVLNAFGRNLVDFGVALGPVPGWVHGEKWNPVKGKYEHTRECACYSVSVVNGSLCAVRMQQVPDLDADGNPVMVRHYDHVQKTYVEAPSSHWEVPDAKIRDGKVRVNGQNLSPVSPADLDRYRRGVGGLFKGYADRSEDVPGTAYSGLARRPKRDVFIVPDNRNCGFARVFAKDKGEKMMERAGIPARKPRQNFSLG